MKILVTADIHANKSWQEWLLSAAPSYDLVINAGDVLNMFSDVDCEEQIIEFLQWMKRFQELGVPMALCSGNHDHADQPYCGSLHNPDLKHLYFYEHWLEAVRDENCVVSPETRLLVLKNGQKVVVTALHWYFMSALAGTRVLDQMPEARDQIHGMLDAGSRLSSQNQCPWLWLHHEPPCNTMVCEDKYPDEDYLHQLISSYKPDVICSGHWHAAPFMEGGGYYDHLGRTLCLNPGHIEDASTPCHINLDYNDGEFVSEHIVTHDSIDS